MKKEDLLINKMIREGKSDKDIIKRLMTEGIEIYDSAIEQLTEALPDIFKEIGVQVTDIEVDKTKDGRLEVTAVLDKEEQGIFSNILRYVRFDSWGCYLKRNSKEEDVFYINFKLDYKHVNGGHNAMDYCVVSYNLNTKDILVEMPY